MPLKVVNNKNRCILTVAFATLMVGCGPNFYKPGLSLDQPAEITVSAYSQDGCLENLQEEAHKRNLEVKLKDIQTELGWQILLFPYYKGYRCTGVVEPKRQPESVPLINP
jgi:hypothetical protein